MRQQQGKKDWTFGGDIEREMGTLLLWLYGLYKIQGLIFTFRMRSAAQDFTFVK
jgi:hypothetical protein